ncbi:MAG: hypothetical protein K2N73_12615 [Lachnospiraceae bacterium]|nr:hypothetical protein [Lachnospiraceae bacterium]
MHSVAETGNRHLAFMSLISANEMFSEIHSEVNIKKYDALNISTDFLFGLEKEKK